MKESHLAFALIVGLDFLNGKIAILAVGNNRYGLKTEKGYTCYPFLSVEFTQGKGLQRLVTTVGLTARPYPMLTQSH